MASSSLTVSDYQCLAALAHFGRRRMRRRWAQLQAQHDGDPVEPVDAHKHAELGLSAEQRGPLLAALRADTLPWQALAETMQAQGMTALIGEQLPWHLRTIPDPPLALYLRGSSALLERPAVAVVGARRAGPRALAWARRVGQDLAASGLVVVSGMALGVDAASHEGAMLAQGATAAVLGSGLARPSPPRHATLMGRIITTGGVVVSEYPPTQSATKHSFPERNRIVTGLALGLVVVAAGARSGTLISARLALEQGREVMAVPGPVGAPGSQGCHRLLKQGAALVESAQDVLDVLGWHKAVSRVDPEPRQRMPADPNAAQVFNCFDAEALSVDALIRATGLSAPQVAVALSLLELDGFVQRVAQGYIRSP